MQYRNLGKSNLQVSRLCLGTMMFGDQTPREEAAAIVADAHAQGVNYIDTADVYTKGASETMLGELLRGQRHHWVLATKLGNPMSDRVNEAHYSRSWMLREVEASLGRLQTDHVDILYLHRDYNGMNLEEPLRALDAMLRAGKIRYWGVSNFRGWRITELVHLARQMGMPGPVVCQRSRYCRPAPTMAWASPLTARWRAACSRANTCPVSHRWPARGPHGVTSASRRPSGAQSRWRLPRPCTSRCASGA